MLNKLYNSNYIKYIVYAKLKKFINISCTIIEYCLVSLEYTLVVHFFFVPLKLNNVFWNVPLKIVT